MTRRSIVVLTAAVIIAAVVLGLTLQSGRNRSASSDLINQSSGGSGTGEEIALLTGTDRSTLEAKIEQWNGYTADAAIQLGSADCPASDNRTKLSTLNSGEKKKLELNEGYTLVMTPNTFGWSTSDAVAFSDDDTVICGVGEYAPFVVVSDRVLWRRVCGSGLDVDAASPDYPAFTACMQADEVVSVHFKLTDETTAETTDSTD